MTGQESLCECGRLRSERDYYRRRWIVRGIRYPHHLGYWHDKYVAAVMEALGRARTEDVPATSAVEPNLSLQQVLNQARTCLRDAEDETTNGLTANPRFIDQRVAEARQAVDQALLILSRDE